MLLKMQISLYVCDTKSAKSGLITCISSIEYLCYADHSRNLLPRSAFTCNISNFHEAFLFTRGQFWPSGIVIACVCGSVCVCINHELVRTITHRPFKLGSPNLDQRCKTPWFGSLLFLGMIDLDFQGQI